MRLHMSEFSSKSPKSPFLTQNVRFPAWDGGISTRGIERSNLERLSRVPPRSFGPIVNFLMNPKISKITLLEKCSKIALGGVWEPSPESTWVLWSKYLSCAFFRKWICLKNFCLPKYAIAAKIEGLKYQNIAIFNEF